MPALHYELAVPETKITYYMWHLNTVVIQLGHMSGACNPRTNDRYGGPEVCVDRLAMLELIYLPYIVLVAIYVARLQSSIVVPDRICV